MNEFQRKITLRVFGGHILFVAVVFFLIPSIRGCFKPKPKEEIVTFIEFGGPAPQVSVQKVEHLPDPEPPAPAPEPQSAEIPEPPREIPKPKPKPKLKPKAPEKKVLPKPKEPEKKKWEPTKPEDINPNKSRRIHATPSKPALSSSDINKALAGITAQGSTGNPSRFNDYYAQVMSFFYDRWKPPASASSATGSTVVKIKIRKNGQIRTRAKIKGSGDPLYDKTVMDAVNSAATLPKPPADYPYDYVQITFTLDN